MRASRIAAIVLVVVASLWIGSGVFGRSGDPAEDVSAKPAATLFKVAVAEVRPEMHARGLVLSGRTEADDRGSAVARTDGVIDEIRVQRGSKVEKDEVIAVLSDEARQAQVAEAKARVSQMQAEVKAKLALIDKGISPRLGRPELEAQLAAAEAALAQAEVELRFNEVRAPIAGTVSAVPVSTGQAVQQNATVAEIVALDPLLAVVEVAERQLSGIDQGDSATVRLVTGETVEGIVRFVSPTASAGTRTYRIDVEIINADGAIPDGVTAEVAFRLDPVLAARVPRSALTFSAEGKLSLRVLAAGDVVETVPVAIAEDASDQLWVTGLGETARVIVEGQDFVRDGQKVEAVETSDPALISRS